MSTERNHPDHAEPTLGCLDCAADPDRREAYWALAVADGKRIIEASRPTPPTITVTRAPLTELNCAKPVWGRIADRVREARNERELDRWAFEDRNTLNCAWGRPDDPCLVCRADFAALPWWRRAWARITGRWSA